MLTEHLMRISNDLKRRNAFTHHLIKQFYIYCKYYQQSFLYVFKKVKIDEFYLEFTSVCNLNCKFCSLDDSREKGYMKEGILRTILEEIQRNKISIRTISLHLAGETLLHPKCVEFLEIIGEYKKQIRTFPRVALLTNATVLTKDLSRRILETNILDQMSFSVDGGTKERFEAIRTGAKWESVLENVNDFLDLNKSLNTNIRTQLITILLDKKDERSFSPEFIRVKRRVTECLLRDAHNFIGDVDLNLEAKPGKSLCHFIVRDFAVFWEGSVPACCMDLNGRGVIGDLKKQTIQEIFLGKRRQNIIKMLRQNKRRAIPSCANCAL